MEPLSAGIISSLELGRNKITLLLQDHSMTNREAEDVDISKQVKPSKKMKQKVQIDLSMTAHANACVHHSARKKHQGKEKRTHEAAAAALQAAEKKVQVWCASFLNSSCYREEDNLCHGSATMLPLCHLTAIQHQQREGDMSGAQSGRCHRQRV